MKSIYLLILIVLNLNVFGQDFSYLADLKIENNQDSEDLRTDAEKSSSFILSIPIDSELNNRQIISSFLFKWNSLQLSNGFQINKEISDMIKINENFLSVYQSCIAAAILTKSTNVMIFEQIENECVNGFIKYCETYQFENNDLNSSITRLKSKYVKKELEEIKAPNEKDNNGLKQGKWRENYDNQQFAYSIINYKDNIMQGEFTAYLSDNSIYMKGFFENGKMTGDHFTYYETGELKMKTEYVEGNETGIRYQYFENGKIFIKAEYLNNKLNGDYYQYRSNGDLEIHSKYKNGKKIEE